MNKILIEVPMIIPRELTPNRSRRMPWGMGHRLKEELQMVTFWSAREAIDKWQKANSKPWLPLEYVTINFHFHVRDQRSVKDDDNVISGTKYMIDVLQVSGEMGYIYRAGIIRNDKDVKFGKVNWYLDGGDKPYTVIEVIEREEND